MKILVLVIKKLSTYINESAINGHLNCLKFAHENNISFKYIDLISVAKLGHLECLKYILNPDQSVNQTVKLILKYRI